MEENSNLTAKRSLEIITEQIAQIAVVSRVYDLYHYGISAFGINAEQNGITASWLVYFISVLNEKSVRDQAVDQFRNSAGRQTRHLWYFHTRRFTALADGIKYKHWIDMLCILLWNPAP